MSRKKTIQVDRASVSIISADTENLLKISVKSDEFPYPAWEFFVPGTDPNDVPIAIIESRMKHDHNVNIGSIISTAYPSKMQKSTAPSMVRVKKK